MTFSRRKASPTVYTATPIATAHSPALPGLSLPSPFTPQRPTLPLPCLQHLTPLPPPLSHHVPSSSSQQPLAGTSTVAVAAAPAVNSSTSATSQTVAEPTLVPSARKDLKPNSTIAPPSAPSTPINIAYLAAEQKHHPDKQFAADLLHDLQWGSNIGYSGPRLARITPNLKSALLQPDAMLEALAKEVSRGHTAGPFSSPPLPSLHCSPLGVVPKKDGTWQIIMDLSSPYGSSINDFISKDDFTLHYATFDQALTLIARHGRNALLAKLDIKHAFCLYPVRLEDREFLGIHGQDKFYIDLCLPFGLRSSPFLFNRLADAFEWILKNNHHIQDLMHYLDDYFSWSRQFTSLCSQCSDYHPLSLQIGHSPCTRQA